VAKICLCLTAKTVRRDLEILEKYRKYADIAELRVDCLDPDERLLVRRFPEQAGMPVILTIRRSEDGGRFVGGEGARINLLARGLAFADADRRLNFAYLDVEDDLNVPSLEEAARTFGTKIIRSRYIRKTGADLSAAGLSAAIRSMGRSGDEIVKLAVVTNSTTDVLNLFRAGKECAGQEKILIGTGRYGTYSRILAEKFGSYLSYSGAYSEPDVTPAFSGQIDVRDLAEIYRFRSITSATRVFGVVGYSAKLAAGPFFFNTVFMHDAVDAVYAPFPTDSIESFMNLADDLDIAGLSVTVPFKEAVVPFLEDQSLQVRNIGACNTLIRRPGGWFGSNIGTQAFSDSLLHFTGRTHLKRQRVTLIGAGGMAKSAAAELHRLGAKVLILNRTLHKARDLAAPYKFAWGELGERGVEMMDRYRDIIVQATPAGMSGTGDDSAVPPDTTFPPDILEMYSFSGREKVMDLVYDPEMTPFLKRAVRAGCMIINGYDMLTRQARYQYTIFTGRDFPEYLLRRVRFSGN
jgi:3-dehydroquinate dehydratase/shikimate dehydrogenase